MSSPKSHSAPLKMQRENQLCNLIYIIIFLDNQFHNEANKNKRHVNNTFYGGLGSLNKRSHTENTNLPL